LRLIPGARVDPYASGRRAHIRHRDSCYFMSRYERSYVNVESTRGDRTAPDFAFLTSYGKTLLLIADDPRIRMRDIADRLKVTERATQRIVAELARAGYNE